MSLCNGCLGCSFCDGGNDYEQSSLPSIKMGDKPTMTHNIGGQVSCNIMYRYFYGDEYLYAIEAEWYDAAEAWLFSRENELLPIVDRSLHIRTGKASIIENAHEHASAVLRKAAKRVKAKQNRRISKAFIREAA